MLVAHLDGNWIDASDASKGHVYRCPGCAAVVILKKGRIVIDHFAHKPPTDCGYAKGETREHRSGKIALRDSFRARGIQAEVERPVLSVAGDRRADVLVYPPTPKHRHIAIELQHQSIDLDQIERRTAAYVAAGVPVLWVPLLRKDYLDDLKLGEGDGDGDGYIERYITPPWLRWLAGYMGERPLWFYDAEEKVLWRGRLSPCELYVPISTWYDSEGNEQSNGGYSKISSRWMRLDLWGSFALKDVRLTSWHRSHAQTGDYNFPGGRAGAFVLAEEVKLARTSGSEASTNPPAD